MLAKQTVFGVGITNATKDEVLEYILSAAEKTSKKVCIVTPNPEMIVYAVKRPGFKTILNQADVALCDGIGLYRAAAFVGKPVKQRITGTDFMELVCERSARKSVNIGLLGGKAGVAEKVRECLTERYPGLHITFASEEWTNQAHDIDILFVAFGHPKQEEWIANNLERLPVKVAMGVGGAFDYISGNVPRAPGIVQSLGFEWLYRLIRQPWRWRRQLALLAFVSMVIRERLKD
jgi:N-acetylglucosaminyldiphosphoundecaprenol N-acetyl-beta-D-mannosaminyltransferase